MFVEENDGRRTISRRGFLFSAVAAATSAAFSGCAGSQKRDSSAEDIKLFRELHEKDQARKEKAKKVAQEISGKIQTQGAAVTVLDAKVAIFPEPYDSFRVRRYPYLTPPVPDDLRGQTIENVVYRIRKDREEIVRPVLYYPEDSRQPIWMFFESPRGDGLVCGAINEETIPLMSINSSSMLKVIKDKEFEKYTKEVKIARVEEVRENIFSVRKIPYIQREGQLQPIMRAEVIEPLKR